MNADERRSQNAELSYWARLVAMKSELLEVFLMQDCDAHARSVLLAAIDKPPTGLEHREFTFNRFNVVLDYLRQEAVIDDELHPADGEIRVPLEELRRQLEKIA